MTGQCITSTKLYKKKKGKDVHKDNRAVQELRREVEKAKRALSSQHQARIETKSFFDGEDFSETLTRARFEELNMAVSAFPRRKFRYRYQPFGFCTSPRCILPHCRFSLPHVFLRWFLFLFCDFPVDLWQPSS